jgi:hypothetical protein
MPRIPIPAGLAAAPFSVADASARGLGRGRLAGPDLGRPFHGVRAVGDHHPALLYAPRLRPGDRFSHTTAAELWGVPLPGRQRGLVHVTAPPGAAWPRTVGIIPHRSGRPDAVRRHGLPASDPLTLFRELAGCLTVPELVAVGDHLVLDPRVLDLSDARPYATIDELIDAVSSATGRGVRAARSAAMQVRAGVESPMETMLRLLLVAAGLPRPLCGYELQGVGWFDLAWPRFRTIAEYDGDVHRTSMRQYDRDIRRFDAATELDWRVIRVRISGVTSHRRETVERVSAALARGGWRGESAQ